MNKQTGVELLKIGAFLYAIRYITAALYMGPGLKTWSRRLFDSAYEYVGNGLTIWAALFGVAGIILMIKPLKKKGNEKDDEVI